ncbi:hypothetical protein G7092_05920 [Mucilaginibacter sp. HC2]|uniref:hypothetical protein n=1 Tax=Mucilaginibacter inviolabilis TaxID=2714892 RepID=UPI00140A70DF|nr:hypothetical protein [Mucilaginibacter inviolabilis]NHA03319.1 hypothetical protein [Mucilaginibacter inviolabilis]
MTTNFKIDFNDAEFEFISMNRVKLQLFQVYVLHEGKKQRFHMQVNEQGTFYITDMPVCPPIYRSLESTFNDAILKLGEVK